MVEHVGAFAAGVGWRAWWRQRERRRSERAENFDNVFRSHLSRLRDEPAAYGQIGLADLFEMREECLRFFRFNDVYRGDEKARESIGVARPSRSLGGD